LVTLGDSWFQVCTISGLVQGEKRRHRSGDQDRGRTIGSVVLQTYICEVLQDGWEIPRRTAYIEKAGEVGMPEINRKPPGSGEG